MDMKKAEDVRETALKLDEIHTFCPEDYFYLKGWIHCLLQKEGRAGRQAEAAAGEASQDRA